MENCTSGLPRNIPLRFERDLLRFDGRGTTSLSTAGLDLADGRLRPLTLPRWTDLDGLTEVGLFAQVPGFRKLARPRLELLCGTG